MSKSQSQMQKPNVILVIKFNCAKRLVSCCLPAILGRGIHAASQTGGTAAIFYSP